MKEKLKYFPITAYAIVMGLSGLTIALGKFYHLQWFPKIFFDLFLFVTFTLFVVISVTYTFKAIYFFEEVMADFGHRIRINFFSALSISLLLLSVAFLAYWPFLSMILWWTGMITHTFFMLHTIRFWIQHNFEIHTMNPSWFIPVVGNIVIPVAGVEFLPPAFNYFFFTVGSFFWIILFAIFLNRVIFHHQLPQKFIPTLFILIAPPAVGFISYMRIAQSWDNLAVFMLFLAYFFVALLIFLRKSFYRLHFYLSWWAFTFPLTAVTIASTVAFQVTSLSIYKYLGYLLFGISVAFISIVTWYTLIRIRMGQICVNEDEQ